MLTSGSKSCDTATCIALNLSTVTGQQRNQWLQSLRLHYCFLIGHYMEGGGGEERVRESGRGRDREREREREAG